MLRRVSLLLRVCSTRSKVKGVFTSGASAALIKKSFPDHTGVVISETAPIPEDLLNVSYSALNGRLK